MPKSIGRGKYGVRIVGPGTDEVHWFMTQEFRDRFVKLKHGEYNRLGASLTKLDK